MEFRQALADEIPFLKDKLEQSGGELVDLDTARIWVAIDKGQIQGMLCARVVWQFEPMLVFSDNKITNSRACYGMFHVAQKWLASAENKTGIRWFFFVTRSRNVKQWAGRMGFYRIYKASATFVKHLPSI